MAFPPAEDLLSSECPPFTGSVKYNRSCTELTRSKEQDLSMARCILVIFFKTQTSKHVVARDLCLYDNRVANVLLMKSWGGGGGGRAGNSLKCSLLFFFFLTGYRALFYLTFPKLQYGNSISLLFLSLIPSSFKMHTSSHEQRCWHTYHGSSRVNGHVYCITHESFYNTPEGKHKIMHFYCASEAGKQG